MFPPEKNSPLVSTTSIKPSEISLRIPQSHSLVLVWAAGPLASLSMMILVISALIFDLTANSSFPISCNFSGVAELGSISLRRTLMTSMRIRVKNCSWLTPWPAQILIDSSPDLLIVFFMSSQVLSFLKPTFKCNFVDLRDSTFYLNRGKEGYIFKWDL